MLRLRVLSALVLVPLVVWGLFAWPRPLFAAFLGAFIAVGAWEWTVLSGIRALPARLLYMALIALAGVTVLWVPALLQPLLIAAAAFWLLAFIEHVSGRVLDSGVLASFPGKLLGGFLVPGSCTGIPRLPNGIQIFPGSVPIYRGEQLVGAIGVSGDGVDQDDMVSFLGLHNAGQRLNSGIGNAPPAKRADQLVVKGARLRYVQCPQAPFIGSDEQNVCGGK